MEFKGRYAKIRRDFYKEATSKFDPNKFVGGKRYKTESGYRKAQEKRFATVMANLDRIEATGTPIEATLSVWYPERSQQARAKVEYKYMKDGSVHRSSVTGGPTGGWGYDKMSTALAEALNKSPEFLKILLDARAKGKKLPYGVHLFNGEPYSPRWAGGVGTECFIDVLKACGYNVTYIRTGIKDSETYLVTKR